MTYFPPATTATTITPRLVTLGDLRLAVAGVSTTLTATSGSDPLAHLALSDPEGALRHADLGLLIVHAGIEGFARPGEDERIVSRASLEALPSLFRVVVAGHPHRFGRARVGECEVIVPGSTERMDFDSPPGSSGFAWLEVTSDGLTGVRRIAVSEQPRADVELTTTRLFPGSAPSNEAPSADANATDPRAIASLAPARIPNGQASNGKRAQDDIPLSSPLVGETNTGGGEALALARAALNEVCTDETLVRLRLVGPISREQYQRLPLRDIQRFGAQRAFAFELDTSGLELVEPAATSLPGGSGGGVRAAAPTGPLSPAFEVERLLQDRLARVPADDGATIADLRAAASILLARLRASSDREVDA
jgi:hypothetical protein